MLENGRTTKEWERKRMKAVSTLKWIRGTQRWNNGRWKIKLGLPRNIKRGRPGAAKPPLSLICWLNVNDTRRHSPAKTSCSASLRPQCAVFDFFSHLSEPFFLFFFSSPPPSTSSLIPLCLSPSGFKGPLYSGAAEVKSENVNRWKWCHAAAVKEKKKRKKEIP